VLSCFFLPSPLSLHAPKQIIIDCEIQAFRYGDKFLTHKYTFESTATSVGTINHAHGEEKSPEIKIYFLAFPMCLRSFAQWESVVINGLEGRKLEVICLMDRRLRLKKL
jgi:hypothetical protein